MVGRDLMARLAMRYDTVVSRAWRRALGIGSGPRLPARGGPPRRRAECTDRELLRCFRNERSIMDTLR